MDGERFKRIVIALRVVLRQLHEIRKQYPGTAALLDSSLGRD